MTTEMAKKRNALTTPPMVTTFESLPLEIRKEILSRLDSKTLTRFRCVSKPLSSVVSTPDVISAHHLRSLQNPLLLFIIHSPKTPNSYNLVSFDTVAATAAPTGITLQKFPWPIFTAGNMLFIYNEPNASVVNLLTKHTHSLPPFEANHHQMIPEQPLIRCNTTYSGFVYVASSNCYKALRVSYMYFRGTPHAHVVTEVFTLGTDSEWRRVKHNPPDSAFSEYPAAVDHSLYYLSTKDFVITKFDAEREEWSVFPPLPFPLKSRILELKGLGGSLCLLLKDHQTMNIDVWMLKNFHTYSWAKEHCIDMSPLLLSVSDFLLHAYVYSVEKDGRILIYLHVNQPKIMYYDPTNMHLEHIDLKKKGLLGHEDHILDRPTFYVDSFF